MKIVNVRGNSAHLVLLPVRSEIENPYHKASLYHFADIELFAKEQGFDKALDAIYSQAKEIDIDKLAEEWLSDMFYKSTMNTTLPFATMSYHDFIEQSKTRQFSDFIKEKIGK